ncbi:SET domain-containing protein, partial [Serendipita vermifera]
MAKRTKKRQSTLPEGSPKHVSALETPAARASIFTVYIIVSMVIAFSIALWYHKYSHPEVLEQTKTETQLWKVVDIPGKGKGVVALRNISQGTEILRERPLFLVPPAIRQSPEDLILSLVSQLSQEKRDQFYSLSYHSKPHSTGSEVPLAIFETNAISAGDKVGIFPRTARLNHGCSFAFNAAYNWRDSEQELVTHAFKPIREGEEILIAYTDTKRPRQERQAYLQQSYNFLCNCAACSLPRDESQASDARLSEMAKLKVDLGRWGQKKIGGEEATDLINKIWNLSEEEGYWSERGSLAWDGTWVAAAHWDQQATRDWAMLTHKWFTIELGADSDLAKAALQIVHR